jgi:putative methanogenesis marker protein 3
MDDKIPISINENELFFSPSITILEAIKNSNEPFDEDCIICKKINKIENESKNILRIETTKGVIDIYLENNKLANIFREHFTIFNETELGWLTNNIVSFGNRVISIEKSDISKSPLTFEKFDTFLFFAGFIPENCHIAFSKNKHEGIYGVFREANNNSKKGYKLGSVIRGAYILEALTRKDHIKNIDFVEELENKYIILEDDDLNAPINRGLELITYIKAVLINNIGMNLDHFCSIIDDNKLKIAETTNSYVISPGKAIPMDNLNPIFRKSGAITIRNSGRKMGSIYIYKRNAPFSTHHNVIGEIVQGFPLILSAREGDNILIDIFPKQITLLGKTIADAHKICAEHDIKINKQADINDDAIIVMHTPTNTMDMLYKGEVDVFGIPQNELIKIQFYEEDAPKSCNFFKEVANMVYYKIGVLRISEILSSFVLLEPFYEPKLSNKYLDAENTPELSIKEGEIGVTNAMRKLKGLIGIRFTENDKFGPTGEDFEGTNIIGKIMGDLDRIKNKNKGDLIYIDSV